MSLTPEDLDEMMRESARTTATFRELAAITNEIAIEYGHFDKKLKLRHYVYEDDCPFCQTMKHGEQQS